MRKTIFIVVCLLISITTFAAHIIGSVMYYEVIKVNADGTSKVRINMDMYRDKSSGGALFDEDAQFGLYEKLDNDNYSYISTTTTAPNNLTNVFTTTNYNDCNEIIIVSVEKTTYSFELELNVNKAFTVAYQRCCRSGQIVNLIDPSNNGSAVTLNLSKDALTWIHKGPKPNGFFERILQVNKTKEVDFSFSTENDIEYRFSNVLKSGGRDGESGVGDATSCTGVRPLPMRCLPPFDHNDFIQGYSFDDPFGNFGSTKLDSKTGIMQVESNAIGLYTLEIMLTETKDNVIMSAANLNWTFSVISKNDIFASGTRIIDVNKNGVKDGEDKPARILINYNGSLCGSAFSNVGEYNLFPLNEEIGHISSKDENWEIVSDSTFDFIANNIISRDVLFKAKNDIAKAEMTINQSRIRCNDEVTLEIKVENVGTEILEGLLVIDYDPLLNFSSSIVNNYVLDENKHLITINISELEIYEDSIYTFNFKASGLSSLGIPLKNNYKLEYKPKGSPDQASVINNEKKDIIGCALDPNNKIVSPEISYNSNDKFIFTVNFENIGNDFAKSIIIKDTIENGFDFNSIKIINSSHPRYRIYLKPEIRELSFSFSGIDLQPKAKGFIRFEMAPKKWELGKQLFNTATIYFDQNPPIKTNNARVLMTEEKTPTIKSNTYLSPNPTDRYIYINYDDTKILLSKIELFDAFGRIIKNAPKITENKIEVLTMPEGIYFIKIYYNNSTSEVFKFVKVY